jgi:hypothetical protein
MRASHARDPGSIPGRCTPFFNLFTHIIFNQIYFTLKLNVIRAILEAL